MPDLSEIAEAHVAELARYRQIGGSHYQKSIQPWDYMEVVLTEEQFKGYLIGNVIKYISRFQDKGGSVDLEKCSHYLDKLKEIW
tara:strand:- start:458 stop:709 length:252 start_codon:yes stop_codon:yes gene_type:complete